MNRTAVMDETTVVTMARAHGAVSSAAGLIPFGHLGWGFRDRLEFARRATEYAVDGLAHDQYVVYVGEGTPRSLSQQVRALDIPVAAGGHGAGITVMPIDEFYAFRPGTGVVDPDASVLRRVAATDAALSAGFTGFRAVIDCTAAVRTPEQRRAFARFEFLIDEKMATLPVSALCAYDLAELGESATSLICLHPFVDSGTAPLQVFTVAGADIALAGDPSGADETMLDELLTAASGPGHRSSLVADLTALHPISVSFLVTLDAAARHRDVTVTLRVAAHAIGHVSEAADLTHVRVTSVQDPTPTGDDAQLRREMNQLKTKMLNQPVIDQAKGMLMVTFGLDAHDAFALLNTLSQNTNLKVREIARLVVDTWSHDGPRPDDAVAADLLLTLQHATRRR